MCMRFNLQNLFLFVHIVAWCVRMSCVFAEQFADTTSRLVRLCASVWSEHTLSLFIHTTFIIQTHSARTCARMRDFFSVRHFDIK